MWTMRSCVLFGKPYIWMKDADGVLVLCGDATFSNVPQRYVMGAPTYEELRRAIIEIEPTEDGWRQFRRADERGE